MIHQDLGRGRLQAVVHRQVHHHGVNNGPADAVSVVVSDSLPATKQAVFVFEAGGCTKSGLTLTCSLGTIAAGTSKSFNVYVRIKGSKGQVTNSASVTSSAFDPNTATKLVHAGGADQGRSLRPAPSAARPGRLAGSRAPGSDAEYPPQFSSARALLSEGELLLTYDGPNGAVRYAFTAAVAEVAPDYELVGRFLYGVLGTHELAHATACAVTGDHEAGCLVLR